MNIELIKKAQNGCLKARDELLIECVPIIQQVISKLSYIPLDVSAKRYGAILGVLAAIKNFNESKNSNFYGYVYKTALDKAKKQLNNEYLIYIPSAKLADLLSKKSKPYEMMSISNLNENWPENIWYSPIDDSGEEIIDRTIPELTVRQSPQEAEEKRMLKNILNELNPLERDAIYHKYGFIKDSLKQLGKKHKVSYEWVRIKEKTAFKKLQRYFLKK